jgi:hypothetical protein
MPEPAGNEVRRKKRPAASFDMKMASSEILADAIFIQK